MGKCLIALLVCIQLIQVSYNLVRAEHQVVQVSNGLRSGEITLHCHSSDQDLGKHLLKPTESFSWGFEISMSICIETSLCADISCDFSWNNKNTSFLVWHGAEAFACAAEGKGEWSVREDGFYFRCDGHDWSFKYSWPK